MTSAKLPSALLRTNSRTRRLHYLVFVTLVLTHFITELTIAEELSLDQKLIVACFRVDVSGVVQQLRLGANANARFGNGSPATMNVLVDPWDGGLHVGSSSWTPLIALASAPRHPSPPIAQIWKDPEKSKAAQKAYGVEVLKERRAAQVCILHVLISRGADINLTDDRGGTALHCAVDANDDNDCLSLVRTMLHYGANVNTRCGIYIDGPSDITPLHVACHSPEVLELLLAHGANADAKDSGGKTAADWVRLNKYRTFDLVESANGWQIQRFERAK